jgi:hypothetical protein
MTRQGKFSIDLSNNVFPCKCGFRVKIDSEENKEQIRKHIDSCKTLALVANPYERTMLKTAISLHGGPDLSGFGSLKF